MTKNEYIEFTNLQEHYEWLHAAEERAKAKLETFTTDDSEFDDLVHTAIDLYFKTEIDKAWKQIEEFKTNTAFVLNRTDAIGYCSKKNKLPKDKTYYKFDFGACNITIDSDVFNKARYACNHGLCDCDACDIKDIPACICCDLENKYNRGEYRIIKSKGE